MFFKKIKLVRISVSLLAPIREYIRFRPCLLLKKYIWFFRELALFKKLKNNAFKKIELQPCLNDNISYTPVEPTYFYQDAWAAKKIFETKPKHHYDVGSSIKTISIISQFVPTTMIDIRPVELKLDNLNFKEGSILQLPFLDNSVDSISSLCVAEHIGLGRYGDILNPNGSEMAIAELKRVTKIGGIILFSVPIHEENKIYFNAHRAFTRKYILELFKGFNLIEEKYIYGKKVYSEYDPKKGFGTGLYMIRKQNDN